MTDDPFAPADDSYRAAKSAVVVPATLLILVGVIGIISAITVLVQFNSLPAKIDDMIAETQNNPNMNKDDKDNWVDMLTTVREWMTHPIALVWYIVNLISAALVVVGGIKFLNLSGPALPTIASVLAMAPCTLGCCCLLSLPVGVWALVVLYRPDVRAAMAAKDAGASEEYRPARDRDEPDPDERR